MKNKTDLTPEQIEEEESFKKFVNEEMFGMRKRFQTFRTKPQNLVGEIVVSLISEFDYIGAKFYVEGVDYANIHLINGETKYVCSREFYWRSIVLLD